MQALSNAAKSCASLPHDELRKKICDVAVEKCIHFALPSKRTQCNIDEAGNSRCCCGEAKKRGY
nr:unnamed protein product [Digitaria exilis]